MINLREVITKYPECLESASKLRSFLVDLYPEEKRSITIITTIFECEIASEIKNTNGVVEEFKIASYCNRLENDYAYSPKFTKECLNLWIEAYSITKKQPVIKNDDSAKEVNKIQPQTRTSNVVKNRVVKYSRGLNIENNILKGLGTCTDTDIVIPEGVFTIGSGAFEFAYEITSLFIPASVKEIEKDAFGNNPILTHNDCGPVFYRFPELVKIEVDEKNQHFCSINGNLYNKDKTILIQYATGNPRKEFAIPDTVNEIGIYAFTACKNLIKIIIPKNTTIFSGITFHAQSIQIIELDYGATSVCDGAFFGTNLSKILLPNSVKTIGRDSFAFCQSLKKIELPNELLRIEDGAFEGCKNLLEISIPDSVNNVGRHIFKGCKNLKIHCSNDIKSLLKRTGNYKKRYFK